MNEYLNWELARMHRAERLQEAEHARRAQPAAGQRRARRLPLIAQFQAQADWS